MQSHCITSDCKSLHFFYFTLFKNQLLVRPLNITICITMLDKQPQSPLSVRRKIVATLTHGVEQIHLILTEQKSWRKKQVTFELKKKKKHKKQPTPPTTNTHTTKQKKKNAFLDSSFSLTSHPKQLCLPQHSNKKLKTSRSQSQELVSMHSTCISDFLLLSLLPMQQQAKNLKRSLILLFCSSRLLQ